VTVSDPLKRHIERGNHPHLPARRHDHQRACPRPRTRAEHNARPLPARRRPHRLPRTTM